MNNAVLCMWCLGAVNSGCFPIVGYNVIGYDQNVEILANLQIGSLSVNEPGVCELIANGIDQPKVNITKDKLKVNGWSVHLSSDEAFRSAVQRMLQEVSA